MKSNERIYHMVSINLVSCKKRIQDMIVSNGKISAYDVAKIASSVGGIYEPKEIDLNKYGWTDISGAFDGKAGQKYFLQLPMIQELPEETTTETKENTGL